MKMPSCYLAGLVALCLVTMGLTSACHRGADDQQLDFESAAEAIKYCEEGLKECNLGCQGHEGCDNDCTNELENCLEQNLPPGENLGPCEQLMIMQEIVCSQVEEDEQLACHLAYEVAYNYCADTFLPDYDACEEGFELCIHECHQLESSSRTELTEECVRGCEFSLSDCLGQELPPPPDEHDCQLGFDRCLESCYQQPSADGQIDEMCLKRCEMWMAECNGHEPPPPPPHDDCHFFFEECLMKCEQNLDETGVPPEDCFQICELDLAACLDTGEIPTPPPEEDCQLWFEECLDKCHQDPDGNNLPLEECLPFCELQFEECLQKEEPPPANDCDWLFDECIMGCNDNSDPNGEIPEDCLLYCEEQFDQCLAP
jgi:hypothetical protein